jgi:hypothetical protein
MSIPVAGSNSMSIPDGTPSIQGQFLLGADGPVVPVHKRLVIEFVAMDVTVPKGQKVLIIITTTLGNASIAYPLVATPLLNFGVSDVYRVSQRVKLYADPGSVVGFTISRIPIAGDGMVVVTLSGYYENKG